MASTPDTYLHGHHDSVLRSHRWRTAGNSAGYLLPRLVADARLAGAWRRWAASDDGWFLIPHGEILCEVPAAPLDS